MSLHGVSAGNTQVRVAIFSERELVRCGLRRILTSCPEISVVADIASNDKIADACRDNSASVLLAELEAGALCDFEPVFTVQHSLSIPVLLLSAEAHHSSARALIAAGVSGYLLKHASEQELIGAIRRLHEGHRYIDLRLRESSAETLFRVGQRKKRRGAALTRREMQLLQGIVQGFTNAETASRLKLRLRTVETYRARLYKKLGLRTRSELVSYANALGLHKASQEFHST